MCQKANIRFVAPSESDGKSVDHSNCACVIDSINSERIFLDSFIHREKKTIKQHYLKCSKERYLSAAKESIMATGIESGLTPGQSKILASCFSEKMYEYDINDSSKEDSRSKERDGAESEIIRSCFKFLGKEK